MEENFGTEKEKNRSYSFRELNEKIMSPEGLKEGFYQIQGEVPVEDFDECAKNAPHELGYAKTVDNKRYLFVQPEKTSVQSVTTVVEEVGEIQHHIHTHNEVEDAGKRILEAPSSSDYRSAHLTPDVPTYLYANGRHMEFGTGTDTQSFTRDLGYEYYGITDESVQDELDQNEINSVIRQTYGSGATDEQRQQLVSRAVENAKRFKLFSQERGRGTAEDYDFQEFVREKLLVDKPEDANGKTYVRYLDNQEAYDLLN